MWKGKVCKRALPIILSMAMIFQSVPATVLAAESRTAEENVEYESTVSGSAVEDDGDTSDVDTEKESEPSAEAVVTESSEEEAAAAEETPGQTEEKPAAEETPGQTEEKLAAKLVIDDKQVDAYAQADNGFTRVLGEKGLVFFTEYVEESECGKLQDAVKGWISVEVDGEKINTLKDRLTYSWVRKAESGEGTDTPLVDAVPGDAGEYELTISMDIADLNGICKTLEGDVKLSLTIEKADIELKFESQTAPGKTAGELIDKINEDYTIQYKNRNIYNVSRDILALKDAAGQDDPAKKLPLHIFVINEDGSRRQLEETERFDRTKDYVLTLDDIALTENAARNYELSVKDSYPVTVGNRQRTEVRFERKDPGEDLIKGYDPAKQWTIAEVTEGLFTEAATDSDGTVLKAGGAPAVYIQDEKNEFSVLLEGAAPVANWYTRIRLIAGAGYNVDEEAGEFSEIEGGITYIYKPLASDPGDAGEYFIIWSYAGDDGAYEKSHSEAVRFTIDPASIIIKIDQESVEKADFRDGMKADDVRKTLAKLSYGVYPLVKNETTGEMEAGAAAVETTPDFFGTSYRGDVAGERTQYYVPEFVLQRRVAKITEKGEASIAVDPKAVEWETTESVNVIVDRDKDELEFEGIKDEELPNDVKKANLESVEFEFRVFFTGQKVIYETDGNKAAEILPITDVTTSAANRNYLADVTKKTLEDTAVPVTVKRAESVQIVTDAIVDAFKEDNKDMLYPQPEAGAGSDVHQGTLEMPAVKIYDRNALFKDRASYKKAKVHKNGPDGEIGEALSIASTDQALQYTWNYTTLEKYEEYLETWDEVQKQYKDFEEYYYDTNLGWGWTDVTDGTLASFMGAGLYRLTVTYDDPSHEYQSAEAEVFFKVECQEVIVVPTEKYAKTRADIDNWKNGLGKKIGEDFTIYRLPHNSMEEYNALTDEAKKGYELPTEETIAEFESQNGHSPDMDINLEWKVLRKEKDPATGLEKDPAVWVEAAGNFDDDYTYGVVAHWTGNLFNLESENVQENYTTKDIKTYRETGEEKHHEAAGDVRFYTRQLYVEIDAAKIKELGHEYDGNPVSLEEAAKALTFYTDEALTAGSKLSTEDIVNTTDAYDPAKVNIYWIKNGNIYANKDAVYGGTYGLALRFAGGGLTAAADASDDAGTILYAPGVTMASYINNIGDGTDGTFTVTPRDITITPGTMPADLLTAGGKANGLLTNRLTLDDNVVEKDKRYFEYTEIEAGAFDVTLIGSNADGTDREGFAYQYIIDKNGGYPAFNNAAQFIIQVDGREIKNPANEYLRFNSTYTVKLTNELASPLKESYRVTYGTAEVKIEKRGNADVAGIAGENNGLSAGGIVYEFKDSAYTVKPRGAVRYYANNVGVIGRDGAEALANTNILGFRIYAPKEFLNDITSEEKFVYQNAVWNAGGYFLGDDDWRGTWFDGEWRRYIEVVFPLTKEDTARSFPITWEDGYTETFTLADIVLEEDLTKAVAPKSLKFNGVSTKMAVGEKQQLDLKITKAQLGDVIAVRYRIKGGETKNEYISLDPETGVVTALKAGKTATVVEAYPVYKDAKGNFVPVLDKKGKEAKAASTKITVTEVTAATVKKIIAQGEEAKLYFTVPDNGYRREIYVVDVTKGTANASRKKWKQADFNKAIDGITNGEWENAGFAIQPIYSYAKNDHLDIREANGTYDKKLKAHITTIRNLEAEREYVIYVRNVSAARGLDDGSVVVLSASGAVKSFKTTKPQVQRLELDFTIKTGEKDKKNTVTHPVNADGTIDVTRYTVELSAKKAQLNVYGLFSDKAGGNEAAEPVDQRRYSLVPTLKEERDALKRYQMPKLEYVVYDDVQRFPFTPGLEQSKYAAINKKGLISLKGVDLDGEKTVCIYVRDGVQHQDDFIADARIELTITAKPASVTGKKIKMKVGQTLRLSDCLEYKDAKKKKIPDYRSERVMITKEVLAQAQANGYRIEDLGADRFTHDWYITALSPKKAVFNLAVTDFDAEGNPMETAVKLTSAQIDPVKGLKVTYVDDQNFTITFTHSANLNENDDGSVYAYALEVKDARGNVVEKTVISNPNVVFDIDGVDAKELKRVQSWYQHTGTAVWIPNPLNPKHKSINVNNANPIGFNYYTGTHAKTKTFAYTYRNQDHAGKLVRLSSYTISVTPLFENQKANKAVTVKTKTTNDPACDGDVDITGAVPDKLGGHVIQITSSGRQTAVNGGLAGAAPITAPYRLISGNTYTLELVPDDAAARDRVTDTLTWKSSNTKVASVKANPGTYTATFKAANQGRTTITVTSKVTKKVIARWAVTVYAVKDGKGYGGDYEPTWQNGFYENILALYDPFYEGRLEVLSMDVPLVIDNKDAEGNDNNNVRTWVSFTAPHYGQYTFSRVINDFYDSRDGKRIGGGTAIFLEANQKVYFSVNGDATLGVTGTELARLEKTHTKDAPLEVKEGYVSFTAWEDNVYTFWHNGTKLAIGGQTETRMKAGDTKYIQVLSDGKMYVTWREETAEEELKLGSHPTGTVTLDKDNQVRYISFTANTAGEYEFRYTETDGVVINFSSAGGGGLTSVYEGRNDKEIVKRFILNEGEKVVIEFRADPEITDVTKTVSASVTVTAQQRRKLENGTITIPKGTTEIVEYVIPSFTTEKAKFRFKVSGETGTSISRYYDKDYQLLGIVNGDALTLTVSKTSNIKAGDSIYIMVRAGGSADNAEAKDAVLTVTQVPVDTLTVGTDKTKEVTNDTEQWYTFTAPGDGYYEFGVTVADRAEGDTTPTHSVSFALCKELFDTNGDIYTAPTIRAMKTGEMVAVELRHGTVADKTKEDGTTEAVRSNATLSVKALDIKSLALGEEKAEQVQIPAKSKEVRYYSFTAAVGADYTIAWQPAAPETDNARVTYFNSITSQSGMQTVSASGSSIRLATGEVRYIKVVIQNPASENAVNGKICITAANWDAEALTVDTAYAFRLEDKDSKGVQKILKFTAPEAGTYAIVTAVKDKSYVYPTINNYAIGTPYDSVSFEKGETKYFVLSFRASGEDKLTEGTITVRSAAEPFTGEQEDVSVERGIVKEYTYTLPESGRYEFKADYDTTKASVSWTGVDGNYYAKNTKVRVTVRGLDGDAAASVKLYQPALINITALNVGENKIEVKAGETKYYELSVGSEPKYYTFELSDQAADTATANMRYAADNGNSWERLSDGSEKSMEKNSRLIIKIWSSSTQKDVNCKLNITEEKELKIGANTVHLDAGETVRLRYRAVETGYYSFRINEPGKELTLYTSQGSQSGDSLYDIAQVTAKVTRVYTLTNNGSGAVDLTVTMSTVEPIALEPGGKTEAKTIPAGQKAYYALKTFKNATYLIQINDTSKGEDLRVELGGMNVTGSLKKTADGVSLERNLGGESLLCITNIGTKETSVTVELAVSEVQPLPDGAVTIAKDESRMVSFVAAESTRYLITKDNDDVTMTLVSVQKISDGSISYPPNTPFGAYTERILDQGDKLTFRLSYTPGAADEQAKESQTVNVKITKIVPKTIEAEATSLTLAEKDNRSVWYQFTAAKDAIHTFTLEDADGNKVSNGMRFYRYFTDATYETNAERHMKAGRKVYIHVNYPAGAGSYTLKYTTLEALTETGVKTLDFEYENEVQEVKFVVPKSGIYKVSATAIRGGFTVIGRTGSQEAVKQFDTNGGVTSYLLTKDDIVTFTVTATQGGNSSVTLRIAEDSVADTLTLGREYAGVSDTKKDVYYEIRISKKATYSITADGSVTVWYYVNGRYIGSLNNGIARMEDLDKDDRLVIKVGRTTTEQEYKLKVEEVPAASSSTDN